MGRNLCPRGMMNNQSKRRSNSRNILRLVAVATLALSGLAFASSAGAQIPGYDGGTTGADSATGSDGPDGGVQADGINADAGQDTTVPPSSNNNPPSSNNNPPSTDDIAPNSVPAPTVVQVTTPAPTVVVTPVTVGGAAQTPAASAAPAAGQLGRTGSSAGTMAIVAAAIVLMGSALVLGARRRRQG